MRNNVPNITRAGKEIIKKEAAASTINLVESKVIVTAEEQKTISNNIVKEKKSFIATLISDNLVSQAMRSKGKAALIKNETFITVAKDQEFITEEYIRQRFDTLNLSEYLKLYTPDQIKILKENRIQYLLSIREECLNSKDIIKVTKVLSKFFDPNEKENGFSFGFCADLISEILSKGYQNKIILNKLSATEMYDLIQKNNNQDNFLNRENINITMQEDKAESLSQQAFQRVLEIKDAVHLANNNPEKSVHITFDKDLSTVIKDLKLENFEIENDKSNKNYDFLFIDFEKKTIRLMDSKSVDFFKAVSQIKKGYLNCVYGIGVLDEVKKDSFFQKKDYPEISSEIYKQLVNSTNFTEN